MTDDRFWEGVAQKVQESRKLTSIQSHWNQGVPWEDTDVFKWTLSTVQRRPGHEGCYTREDVSERYRRLDEIYEEVRRNGRFRTRQEVDRSGRRETGAPVFHLGEDGEPIFAGEGYHRFAIALSLGVRLPAKVGTVHVSALQHYSRLTKPNVARTLAADRPPVRPSSGTRV